MDMQGQSIVSIRDFSKDKIKAIVDKALEVKQGRWDNALNG